MILGPGNTIYSPQAHLEDINFSAHRLVYRKTEKIRVYLFLLLIVTEWFFHTLSHCTPCYIYSSDAYIIYYAEIQNEQYFELLTFYLHRGDINILGNYQTLIVTYLAIHRKLRGFMVLLRHKGQLRQFEA